MRFTLIFLFIYLSVVNATNFKIEAAGNDGTLLLSNGKVTATGLNAGCVLGLGYTDETKVVSTPEFIFQGNVVDIACTQAKACCAVKTDGKVYCWGKAVYLQLGDGQDTTNACSPQEVTGVDNIDAIRASMASFHARKSDGTLIVWGSDIGYGEAGMDQAGSFAGGPTANPHISNVAKYEMFLRGGILIKTDGTVYGTGEYSMWGTSVFSAAAKWTLASNIQDCTNIYGGMEYNSYCTENDGQLITMGYFGEEMLVRGGDNAASCGANMMNQYFGPCNAASTSDKTAAGITIAFTGVVDGDCTPFLCYWMKADGSIWITGDIDYSANTIYSARINPDSCSGTDLCSDGTDMTAAVKLDSWGTDNKRVDCTKKACFVLKDDNTIKGIGENTNGELGTGDLLSSGLTQGNPIKTSLFVIGAAGPTACAENNYGDSGACTACPANSVRAAGDMSDCTDCSCQCIAGHYGSGSGCLPCPAGSDAAGKAAGDSHTAVGSCSCNVNFFGGNGLCTACPLGSENAAGDDNTCDDCSICGACGCTCLTGFHVEELTSEPGPEYVSINGVADEKKFELTFSKDLKHQGQVTGIAQSDLVITGTYTKPGGETFYGYKWNAIIITGENPFDTVLSVHDTEAAATALCDNLCVGIDHVDMTSYTYDYTAGLLNAGAAINSLYCGPYYYTPQLSEVYCDGTLIEAKTFTTELAGKTSNQIYQQYTFNGGVIHDYCKNLGNCGCIEPDISGSTWTDDIVFRFYESPLCSENHNSNKVNACGLTSNCIKRFKGTESTTKKWRVIHSSVSARVAEVGATAKTVGSAQSITGPLSIVYAKVDTNADPRKLFVTIGNIDAIPSGQTLLDTTTLTSIAYTNNNNFLKTSDTDVSTASFSSAPVADPLNTACTTGPYPCFRCAECGSGLTRIGGDSPSNAVETSCIASGPSVDCAINQHVVNFVCTNCPVGETNPAGVSLTNQVPNGAADNLCCGAGFVADSAGTACEVLVVCNGNKYAKDGACHDCPTGTSANLVNYRPSIGDTSCLCQGEMASNGTHCIPCPQGRTNALVDYDPTSGVKECVVQSCAQDHHVLNHECAACPHNSQRLAGDDPAGPETRCHCRINSKVIGGDCLACETGSTNPKLCYASKEGGDTHCTCNENYHADASKICTECPAHSKNEAGDYGGDGPTYCNCKQGYHVEGGACKKCQDNSLSIGSDELNGGDTYCTCAKNYYASSGTCTECPVNTFNDAPTKSNVDGTCKCNANFKVSSNVCVACELSSTRVGGSVMGGADTYCVCGLNEKVSNNECIPCEAGSSFPGQRDASGANNQCICDAGYEKNSISKLCEVCPAGTDSYSPHGADAPCLCKPGYYVNVVGSCNECPTGSTADGGNSYDTVSTCQLLEGYFVDSSGAVQECPSGSTSNGGEMINGGETKCKTEANHYVDVAGDVQDCPANSAVAGGILVEARAAISGCICEKGFQAVGSACGQCPDGQTTDGTHRTDEAQRDCFCREGYYVDDSDHSCKECSFGGSTQEGGDPNGVSTSCDCARNFRVDATAQCTPCSEGETNEPLDKTQDGETQCDITRCGQNHRVQNHQCVGCPIGMENAPDDAANSINTICDYQGAALNQYEFDVSGSSFLVQRKDGTNLGLNGKITLRIGEGPFTFSRQPASIAGDDLVVADAVVWDTPDVSYTSYTQVAGVEAIDDVKVAVWNPTLPGTYYYLSKDTNTMIGEIEVTLPLCVIGSTGNVQLSNSCILPNEITVSGMLSVSVSSRRRRFLKQKLKSAQLLVQAAANSRHFSIPAGSMLSLNGFTLSDGNPGDAGGSILASGGVISATGMTWKDNVGTTGGAIEAEKDQANNSPMVTIKGSTFDNNEGTGGGGAINAKAGVFNVDASVFKNNKAPNGDGGALAAVTDVTITGSTFEANSAPSGSGGAVAVDGKQLTMTNVVLKSNNAQNGGALGMKGGMATLSLLEVESNSASAEGGAILVDESDVTMTSSNIRENNGATGGGIKTKNMGGKQFSSTSNTFNGNSGSSGGGAFHFDDDANADIQIFKSSFINNKGVADEADDMKSDGATNIAVKVVDLLSEIVKKDMPQPDCSTIDCSHKANSAGDGKADGSCRCACDGTNEYEKDNACTAITICGPGEVSVVEATDSSDRICGTQSIADKQSEFDAEGAALSSLVTNKLKESGLGDADAFNLAVDMIGGVNKC